MLVPPTVSAEFEAEDRRYRAAVSWVVARETTRVEDEAYCLMGRSSINPSTLYGESRLAFYRMRSTG